VINAGNGMRDGDLLVFGADGNALRRIDLGDDSDPTQLLKVKDEVLVADPTRFVVTRLDLEGNVKGEWGDMAFVAEMKGLREQRRRWRLSRYASQGFAVLFPLMAVVILWRRGKRPSMNQVNRGIEPLVGASPMTVAGDVHWLPLDKKTHNRQKFAFAIVGVLLALAVTLPIFIIGSRLALIAFFPVAVAAPMIWYVRRIWRKRLGTDGTQLVFDVGDGIIERHRFEDVLFDGRSFLAGRELIEVSFPVGDRFVKEDIQRYLLTRLPPENRINVFKLSWLAMRRGNRMLWNMTAVIVVLFFAMQNIEPLLGWLVRK